eukprot:TRINITY_DN235_c0_g2_i2.p3 TRINITY_DN235_c0_g2~~TRINITY_DN235_c0_g2_i2.p3  ORF type:complete len:115 (+),score=3.65 TRINITY_DN235_c0_g2_i2:31-375(+)
MKDTGTDNPKKLVAKFECHCSRKKKNSQFLGVPCSDCPNLNGCGCGCGCGCVEPATAIGVAKGFGGVGYGCGCGCDAGSGCGSGSGCANDASGLAIVQSRRARHVREHAWPTAE